MTFVLKLPHSPLSAVTTITSVLLSGRRSRTVSSGWIDGSTRDATLCSTRCICTAYGRAFMMRSCARRSLDAATIFIAFVICCVFLTARIRRRRSISDGIVQTPTAFHEATKNHEAHEALLYKAFLRALREASCLRDKPSRRGRLSRGEVLREFLDRRRQRGLQLIVQDLFLDDAAEYLGVTRLDEAIQLDLEIPDLGHRDAVEIPVRAGEDDRHLAL